MKKIILILFIFCGTLAAAQKIPDYGFNRVRLSGEDRTTWFETLPVSKRPKPELGKTYFWYASGQVQSTQGGFSGKLLNGFYRVFYTNKNLMEEGSFNAGLRNGVWKNWAPNGVLTETTEWLDGRKNGISLLFDEKGALRAMITYKNGVINGVTKQYFSKDSVVVTYYKNGSVIQPVPLLKRINPFRRKKTSDASKEN